MKAIVYNGFGDVSVVAVSEVPPPKLRPGEVRIAVEASGLNRADLSQRRGNYPPPPGESEIPGLEVSGTILECSPASMRFKIGTKVMALLAGGGYADEVCVDDGLVMPLPQSLCFEEGAAIPEAFLTAYRNIFELGDLKRGQTVLIHAGASGVGTAALQIVKNVASQSFVTVGTEAKAATCRQLGAASILYKQEDFATRILELTEGKGVDLILDPVGASYFENNLKCLKTGGTIVHIGLMGGSKVNLDLGSLMQRRATLVGSTLRALPLAQKREAVANFSRLFLKEFDRKTLRPIIDKIYPYTDAPIAQTRMEANQNIGKIILQWPPR